MQAIVACQPLPGLVHHSDRGVQYAFGAYVEILKQHEMIPSMSRSANPYDNASCESFLKTLKREEIYAHAYRDLVHLCANLEDFFDQYDNRVRLHATLGYRPPKEFVNQHLSDHRATIHERRRDDNEEHNRGERSCVRHGRKTGYRRWTNRAQRADVLLLRLQVKREIRS